MTVTPADLQAMASELAGVDTPTLQAWIDRVERRTNRDAWGVKADDGVLYASAHYALMQLRAAAAGTGGGSIHGPLSREKVGPLEREYGSNALIIPWGDAWFAQTSWGVAYLELRSTVFACRVI